MTKTPKNMYNDLFLKRSIKLIKKNMMTKATIESEMKARTTVACIEFSSRYHNALDHQKQPLDGLKNDPDMFVTNEPTELIAV